MLKTPLKTLLDILINHFTKERLVTLITGHDEKLLTFMLEHENANDYKNTFFKMIANSLVFNEKALLECLEIKELDRSFTRFKNKIGLFSQEGFIKSSGSVVLHFPFKDNVLLGSAKDNNTKSNELFYHEILHKNEIDVLLSPKVLCCFEMHGQGDLQSALKDENTNYLIKGNNLIALHSLKKKFAKQVKCIYIDPPYNTGNDSFNYNDNFNHSSWLVFMKNRLEAAREFLSDDGVIFVQCDDNEQAYLKVLMDEIFLRENFVASLHVELSTTQGMKVASAKKGNIVKNAEYILIYSKNMENFSFIRSLYVAKEWDEHYSIYIDPKTKKRETLLNFLKSKYENITKDKIMALYNDDKDFRDFVHKNADNIYRDNNAEINFNFTQEQESNLNSGEIVEYNQYLIFKNSNNIIRQLLKLSDAIGETDDFDAKIGLRKIRGDWWGSFYKDMMNINKEANLVWKAGKKPERLIRDILEISTQENDLVLDFFAGSGTTCAVAHKMKRRYIGIEQMDYIETITKERLKKVIEGEQGGISKKCDFKGGGSFVYAELKEVNLGIKKQILNAKSASECLKIFNDLNKRILKRADNKMDAIHSEEFQNLDLNEQKRKCCASLDSNEDYLNLGDIDEDAWGIDEITKKYNEIFYS
ncbi:DNA (cytosine-5-)-methyltransferase [Helicobacter pylori GAM260Bi]|uniref:site-specific DNA-methyltransferase n=1 Tax=Helicobacter pylori TaxID=210 RepID=UPI0002BB9134|nr:site-specific DNA-methyltransferase [Helicobacter pylori]EMH20504.1 DNA (cytosine-5-)-methyltransferase [Helicobacter pylori GAM260Bi]EMH70754.1 DNA (cytosine-5-)-methyltransferase [Helicobacter pylori HP260Bi]